MNKAQTSRLHLPCSRLKLTPRLRKLGMLSAGMLASSSALAQLTPTQDFTNMDLEALLSVSVITATQHKQDPFLLPFSTSVRTTNDIARLQPRTLPLAFDGLPGISIQKSGYGLQSPFIRGFTGFRTLMLVDGVRLNNSTMRDGPTQYWTTLDVGAFDRIEVVAGPAAALYGTDSVGGTAQVFTPVTDFTSGPRSWTSSGNLRLASGDESFIGRMTASGPLGKRTQLSLGYTYDRILDYYAAPPIKRVPDSGYDQHAIELKLEHLFANNIRLTVAHQSMEMDDVNRTHSTRDSFPWNGITQGTDLQRRSDQDRNLSYVRVGIPKIGDHFEDAEITLSHQLQEEMGIRVRSDGRKEINSTDVNTYGLKAILRSNTRLGLWTYGLTSYRDMVETEQNRYKADGTFDRRDIQGPVADDSQYDLFGAYVQNQLPKIGKMQLTMRGRYDQASANAGRLLDPVTNQPTSFKDTWRSTSGSLNGTYDLPSIASSEMILFGGISQGFRAPNLSDLSRLDSVGSGSIETPSTKIAPEHYLMNEIGCKMRSNRLSLTATYFYTVINDMIIRRPTGRIINGSIELSKLNSGNGYINGTELSLQYALTEKLTLNLVSSYVEGKVTNYPTSDQTITVDEALSRLPPWTTHLSLRFTSPARTYWAEVSVTAATLQNKLSSLDKADTERIPPGGTPGYAVAHLRGGWNPRENLSLTLALENLGNRDYRVHGSGINEPGRNAVLSVIFKY